MKRIYESTEGKDRKEFGILKMEVKIELFSKVGIIGCGREGEYG